MFRLTIVFVVIIVFVFQTFRANNDQNSVVRYELIPPITTKCIRVIPKSWYASIALRVEFYGCAASRHLRNILCYLALCLLLYERSFN